MTHAREDGVEEVLDTDVPFFASLRFVDPEEGANFHRFSPPPRDVPIYRATIILIDDRISFRSSLIEFLSREIDIVRVKINRTPNVFHQTHDFPTNFL